MRTRPTVLAVLAPTLALTLMLALAPRTAAAQAPLAASPIVPAARSVTVDYHMGKARGHRQAHRWDAALAALDSVLSADPRTPGAHPMRALVLAERGDAAGALAALWAAHRAGDTLTFATALQIGNDRFRAAATSRHEPDLVAAFTFLQLADSVAPSPERRGVARLLVAATALSLANRDLPTGGAAPSCAGIATAGSRLEVARASLTGAEGAPAPQVTRVRTAVEQLAAYADAEARRLRCA